MIRKLLAISILSSFIWTSSLAPLCATGMEDVIPRGADEVTPPIQVNAGGLGMDVEMKTPTDIPDSIKSTPDLEKSMSATAHVTPAIRRLGSSLHEGLDSGLRRNDEKWHSEVSPTMFQSAKGMFFKGKKMGADKPAEKVAEEVGASPIDAMTDKKLSELYDGDGQNGSDQSEKPEMVGYWDSRPDRIEPLKGVDQLNLKDPLIAKAIEEAGRFYEEARKNPPKGRLGGRK